MSSRRIDQILLIAVLLIASAPVLGADELNVRSFARAPAFSLTTLSPDGAIFSYVEQHNDKHQVVLRTLRDGSEQRPLRLKATQRIRWCGWASSRYLLCGTVSSVRMQDRVAERTQLYVVDAAQRRARELNTSLKDPVRDQVIDLRVDRRSRVLIQHDPVGAGFPMVSELDVASDDLRTVVHRHPPVRNWMSDGLGHVRLGIGYEESGAASLWIRRAGEERWSMYLRQSLSDLEAVGPLAFGAEGRTLYVLKNHQGRRTGLFRLDLDRAPVPELVFVDDRYDVFGPLLIDPRTRELQGVRYIAEQERVHFLSVSLAAEYAWLNERLPDAINLTGARSDDGRLALVHSSSDVDPPSIYLFDAGKRELSLLGHEYPELEGRPLSAMRSVTYRARDGELIPAYLTRPSGASSALSPAIVLPHGGPESRTQRGFDPLVQFLAAQGYVVLQMNFRGSLGYGAGFAAAGAGQWGGIIHNDITDGARWLVEQGIADPARMCIVGQSFGGYAALLGATREAQWYSCAAGYAAPTDLMALAQYVQRVPGALLWKERLGEDARALWQMSPLARVATVEAPVMLMHGRLDPVVPVSHARRFARALRNANKPYRFVERADCDHDLTAESCRRVFFSELESFLQASLRER